ncbi:MAG: hypothetical protein ACYC96_06325 [Fimbriimonadaceae bacterium]
MSNSQLVNTTPFPNALFKLLPKLRDTEWRVLCVIVRSTLGWVDPITKRRKTTDWISHRQFKLATGRESEAISRAIDVLTNAGIITVTDSAGRPLASRAIRRRHRGNLRLGIHPRFSNG